MLVASDQPDLHGVVALQTTMTMGTVTTTTRSTTEGTMAMSTATTTTVEGQLLPLLLLAKRRPRTALAASDEVT